MRLHLVSDHTCAYSWNRPCRYWFFEPVERCSDRRMTCHIPTPRWNARFSSCASGRACLRGLSRTAADCGKMEFSDSVLLATLVSDLACLRQDDPAMNQICSYRRIVSVCLCRGVRSAFATCGIIGSQLKKHFRIDQLWNSRVLLWSAVAVAGPDVQLALQLSLAFLGSVGGIALAYTSRTGPHRQIRHGPCQGQSRS
jgi:hypothetical protein